MTAHNEIWAVTNSFWPVSDRWPALISSPVCIVKGYSAVFAMYRYSSDWWEKFISSINVSPICRFDTGACSIQPESNFLKREWRRFKSLNFGVRFPNLNLSKAVFTHAIFLTIFCTTKIVKKIVHAFTHYRKRETVINQSSVRGSMHSLVLPLIYFVFTSYFSFLCTLRAWSFLTQQ